MGIKVIPNERVFAFLSYVQALFVIIRACGINLKAKNFHWIEYENNYNMRMSVYY